MVQNRINEPAARGQAGHTPEPWIAGKPSSVVGWPVVASPSGRLICDINYVHHSMIDPAVPGDRAFNIESAANARLIAAAPELLAALQAIADESVFNQQRFAEDDDTDYFLRCFRAVKERARAAIAKAVGP